MTTLRIVLTAVLALLGCAALAAPQAGKTGYGFRFETLDAEPYLAERAGAVAAVLDAAAWPRPDETYRAPVVTRALLTAPERLSEEVRSCTVVRFDGEPWGRCTWSWRVRAGRDDTGAADRLSLEITLAPRAQAAHEHLLVRLADNMLPTEGLTALYGGAVRPGGLGDAALEIAPREGSEVRLWFVRANVVFHLRASGSLSDEALALARGLDRRLIEQRPLTPEQLRALRPVVRLGGNAVGYTVETGGREVVAVETGAGDPAVEAPAISAGREPAEVVVVTHDLLAGAARHGDGR